MIISVLRYFVIFVAFTILITIVAAKGGGSGGTAIIACAALAAGFESYFLRRSVIAIKPVQIAFWSTITLFIGLVVISMISQLTRNYVFYGLANWSWLALGQGVATLLLIFLVNFIVFQFTLNKAVE